MKSKIILLFIVLLAFFFRLYGLNWDQDQHLQPDERFLTMVASSIEIPDSFIDYLDPKVSTMNPYNNNFNFFVYGTFPLNLTKIIAHIFQYDSYAYINLIGRILSTVFDVGIVFLLFKIGKKLYSEKIGLLSSFLYSIMVLPIQLSHFFAVDPFLNFFIVLTFYFLILLIKDENTPLYVLLIGISFGLALACKVSAVFFGPIIFIFFIYKFFKKNFFLLLTYGLFFLLTSLLIFRINQPQAFSSGNFINWSLNSKFISNIKELSELSKSDTLYPPGIQWKKTTPIIFPLKNMINWGIGIPIGIIFLIALVFFAINLFKKPNFINWSIFVWVFGFFLYQGFQSVKTMRYFLLIYPFITIISAKLIGSLSKFKLKIFKSKAFYICISVILLIYPISFLSIYSHSNTRISASEWIYQNIASGATLTSEYWDDSLPLPIFERPFRFYNNESLHLFDEESTEKWNLINGQLDRSDYIILSSNRLYATIPKNPEIYPTTTQYYQSLFNDQLPFKKTIEFTSRPCFPPVGKSWFCFNDDNAEEAFTVYDHPKVIIFKR